MLIYNTAEVISTSKQQPSVNRRSGVKRVTRKKSSSSKSRKYKLKRKNIVFLKSLGLKVKK